MVVCIQFPAGYPECRLLLELKSKTIPDKLMEKLVAVCDQEADRHLGKKQVREGREGGRKEKEGMLGGTTRWQKSRSLIL